MAQVNTVRDFEQFQAILSTRGVRDALAYLVGLTDYRFIGIWRFQDGKANAAVHFDKENTGTLRAQEVADTATYCCYVRDSKGVFKTAHAQLGPLDEICWDSIYICLRASWNELWING